MDYFAHSADHLLAELERIDLLIHSQVARVRQLQVEDEQFHGLYISEQELDAILNQPTGQPRWYQTNQSPERSISALQQLKTQIDLKKQASLQQGIELRLRSLQQIFQLSPLEIDVVLICLAVELDLRYEKLYAYLQDDVTKKKPNVDLVLNLLQLSSTEKLNALKIFHEDSPLLTNKLIVFISDPSQPDPPLLGKFLKLDPRIVQYLLDSDSVDDRIRSKVNRVDTQILTNAYHLDETLLDKLSTLIHSDWPDGNKAIIYLKGPYGSGKLGTAEKLCHDANLQLLIVDIGRLTTDKDLSWEIQLPLIIREAKLQTAALYCKDIDMLFDPQQKALYNVFIRYLEQHSGLMFLAGESTWLPPGELQTIPFLLVELPQSTFEVRNQMWHTSLKTELDSESNLDVSALASKFKFTGGQIRDAAATAKNLAQWNKSNTGNISTKHLYEACRLHSNQKLSTLARKITPKYQWDDIVLPPDRTDQLREICNFVKYRDRVYTDWGFDAKLAMGKGLNVLFAGPSGTGKTMAADIIAGTLGLDLYKIDLSTVVSKYIGETEKNLSKIFQEAETSNAILFFDEADALFGKRSEAKDAHDRYANIETSYLLQRIEEYEGVVILATNFRKNMDEAFVRRLHFTVEFPFPNERDRRRIWDNVWPEETPRDPDLDFEFIARRFEVSGGNIRNIALGAAFLAVESSAFIDMNHLIHATQREYRKMGKVISDGEFSQQENLRLSQ